MESDVLGRTDPLWESFAKETAVLDQLGRQLGNLQQQIEYPASGGVHDSPLIGLGLWGSGPGLIISGILEVDLFVGGIVIYLATRKRMIVQAREQQKMPSSGQSVAAAK